MVTGFGKSRQAAFFFIFTTFCDHGLFQRLSRGVEFTWPKNSGEIAKVMFVARLQSELAAAQKYKQ